jgi:hypothetical protein
MTKNPKRDELTRADLVKCLEAWRDSHLSTKQSPYEIWLLQEAIRHLNMTDS